MNLVAVRILNSIDKIIEDLEKDNKNIFDRLEETAKGAVQYYIVRDLSEYIDRINKNNEWISHYRTIKKKIIEIINDTENDKDLMIDNLSKLQSTITHMIDNIEKFNGQEQEGNENM